MAVAPLAPEVGGLGALAISFLLLCFCIVAFGMVRFATLLVQAVQFIEESTIGSIPLLGRLVHDITGPVYRAVEHGLADAAIGVQGAIGFYWHALATIATWMAREIRRHADLLLALASTMLPLAWAPLVIHELSKIRAVIHRVEHAGRVAIHRVVTLEHTVVVRAQAAVLPRVHGLEDVIGHVVLPDIAGLRARARSITDRLDVLWKGIAHLDALLGTAAFAAAVAVAITQLGMGWTRCRNWKRIGKGVCGLPANLIESLFVDALDVLVVADLCDFAYLLTRAAEQTLPALRELVVVEDALIGCHGAGKPPKRDPGVLHLPPLINAPAF